MLNKYTIVTIICILISVILGIVSNNLYGLFLFYIFVFSPLQLKGFISWGKNLDDNNNIKVRKFTLKNSIIITISCIVSSFIAGYLLSLIPGQRLALMDASSNCINLCGIVLMILRFREAWWIWLINNIIDLLIWFITVIDKGYKLKIRCIEWEQVKTIDKFWILLQNLFHIKI